MPQETKRSPNPDYKEQDIENTFIIPVIFEHPYVEKCIQSIYKYNDKFRIILIDQTKNAFCERFKNDVHLYIKSYRNLGFAKAMNIGIKIADTPYITLCNDDIEFINKRWFIDIIELFKRAPNILAINPASVKEIGPDRSKDWMPYKSEYTESDYEYLLKPKTGYNPEWVFEGTMMFCTVFRKEAFEMVGLLDEGFFPGSSEDYCWCRRCYEIPFSKTQPHKLVHYNKSFVYHHWLTSKNKYDWNNEDLKKYRRWPGFREKWMTDEEKDPDIYGRKAKGLRRPTLVVPL